MSKLRQLSESISARIDIIEGLEEILPYAPTTQELIDEEIESLGEMIRIILECKE